DAMLARTLRCFNELPALIDSLGGGDFRCGVNIVFHRVNRHGGMQLPGGGDVEQVDLIAFAHAFPVVLTRGVQFRVVRSVCKHFPGLLGTLGPYIAQRLDLYALDLAHALYRGGTATAETDESYPHSLKFGCGITTHIEVLPASLSFCVLFSLCRNPRRCSSKSDTGHTRRLEEIPPVAFHNYS